MMNRRRVITLGAILVMIATVSIFALGDRPDKEFDDGDFVPCIVVDDNDLRVGDRVRMFVPVIVDDSTDIVWFVDNMYEYHGQIIEHTFDHIDNVPVKVIVSYRGAVKTTQITVVIKPSDTSGFREVVKPFDKVALGAHSQTLWDCGLFIEIPVSHTLPTLIVWINMTRISGHFTFDSRIVNDEESESMHIEQVSGVFDSISYYAEITPQQYEGLISDPTLMGGSVHCDKGICPKLTVTIQIKY